MWVGLILSVESLNKTKKLTLFQGRKNSFCWTAFQLGHWRFPLFGVEQKHWLFLDFKPAGLWNGATLSALLGLLLACQLTLPILHILLVLFVWRKIQGGTTLASSFSDCCNPSCFREKLGRADLENGGRVLVSCLPLREQKWSSQQFWALSTFKAR